MGKEDKQTAPGEKKDKYKPKDPVLGKDLKRASWKKTGQPGAVAKAKGGRVGMTHGGGVGIQTHGNKLAKPLNTKRPDQSLFLNSDGYLTGGIKIRS